MKLLTTLEIYHYWWTKLLNITSLTFAKHNIADRWNYLQLTPLIDEVTYNIRNISSLTDESAGAQPSLRDQMGFNALMHAAVNGHLFILHYLIASAKADVNVTDLEGHGILCWAASNGHVHVVQYLLSPHCPSRISIM